GRRGSGGGSGATRTGRPAGSCRPCAAGTRRCRATSAPAPRGGRGPVVRRPGPRGPSGRWWRSARRRSARPTAPAPRGRVDSPVVEADGGECRGVLDEAHVRADGEVFAGEVEI